MSDRLKVSRKTLHKNSISSKILQCLSSGESWLLAGFINPRMTMNVGHERVLRGYFGTTKPDSVKRALKRVEKRGLIFGKKRGYELTNTGWSEVLVQRVKRAQTLTRDRSLMVLFDIPESRKGDRDRLRRLLKSAGCICLQRSVYVTPFDIAADLAEILERIKLKGCVRFYYTEKVIIGE